jgi:hypothetical protein
MRRGPRHVTALPNRDPAPTRGAGRLTRPQPQAAARWPAAHHLHGVARDRRGHYRPARRAGRSSGGRARTRAGYGGHPIPDHMGFDVTPIRAGDIAVYLGFT